MKVPSSSQHTFALAPSADIPRSSFRRNRNYKTTFNAGYLVPVFFDEVLPGDTFNVQITNFARILSPLKYPIMDNLFLDVQFFYCPTRLVFDDYEKFFGSSKGPEGNWEYDDSHLMPGVSAPSGGFASGSIFDYLGAPVGVDNIRVNALPFRAYNLIIQNWYLPSSYGLDNPEVKLDSTDDDATLYPLRKRLKRADAFSAALPEPQRGPGVNINLASSAPVNFVGEQGRSDSMISSAVNVPGGSNYSGVIKTFQSGTVKNLGSGQLVADLSDATAITINSLRQAFQLQRLLERDERSGVQYVSTLLSHFGVRSPDARLQRTEYLGGGSTPIQIHSVANTSNTTVTDPETGVVTGRDQGSLAAYGLGGSAGVGFVKSFVEHGYIIGLASVRADVTYQQGIPRALDRWSRFDYYWPVFAHLGEEAIKNRSIYAQGTDEDDEIFGYQERYWDYRYGVSMITGQLRSNYPQSLDVWHLAQNFNNLPRLNQEFLEENIPMSRVKAVVDSPDFLYDSLISCNCVRPMPLFGVPGLVDHF